MAKTPKTPKMALYPQIGGGGYIPQGTKRVKTPSDKEPH